MEKQNNKKMIQLSEHVKNKIQAQQRRTSMSISSDELYPSDVEYDNNSVFTSPKPARRRSSTFITYKIPSLPKEESFFTVQQTSTSQREDHLQEQLERTREENRKLFDRLQSTFWLHRQSEEENRRLKEHLIHLNNQLEDYRNSFDNLKEKLLIDRYNRSKQAFEAEQIQRLRHELDVYHQITIAKRREEQKHFC